MGFDARNERWGLLEKNSDAFITPSILQIDKRIY